MAKKRKRSYTLADLQAMVDQMGGRLSLDIMPAELQRVGGTLVKKCDFCDKTQRDVNTLIVSPNGMVHICDVCARQCVVMLDEQPADPAIVKSADVSPAIGSASHPSSSEVLPYHDDPAIRSLCRSYED